MTENKDNRARLADEQFMRQALIEAEKASEAGEVPIGAVVVVGGKIIARAHNLTETLHDVTAHAEMQAITAAAESLGGKYLTDCTVYVTVEPCPMCAGALGWAQASRIVWGADDDKRGFRKYAPNVLHARATTSKGVLEDECKDIVQRFFKGKRE
ncbi:MAG: nucleoside deaminase [Prevotella sp.]|nr:nucleoside deaminase [Prevotella sp.]